MDERAGKTEEVILAFVIVRGFAELGDCHAVCYVGPGRGRRGRGCALQGRVWIRTGRNRLDRLEAPRCWLTPRYVNMQRQGCEVDDDEGRWRWANFDQKGGVVCLETRRWLVRIFEIGCWGWMICCRRRRVGAGGEGDGNLEGKKIQTRPSGRRGERLAVRRQAGSGGGAGKEERQAGSGGGRGTHHARHTHLHRPGVFGDPRGEILVIHK